MVSLVTNIGDCIRVYTFFLVKSEKKGKMDEEMAHTLSRTTNHDSLCSQGVCEENSLGIRYTML